MGVGGYKIPNIDAAHSFYQMTSSRSIIVAGENSFPFLETSRQILLEVEDFESVVKRVMESGGRVIEECSLLGRTICVVQGPENIEIFFVEKLNDPDEDHSTFPEAILHWSLRHKNRASDRQEISAENGKWDPPKGTVIPTLFPSILNQGSFCGIYPNSSTPVPFETDLFKGTLLVAIRTTPMEQRYRHMFEETRTCFEVQVQGKFKRMPRGPLFIG